MEFLVWAFRVLIVTIILYFLIRLAVIHALENFFESHIMEEHKNDSDESN